jgi:hypothetical protein
MWKCIAGVLREFNRCVAAVGVALKAREQAITRAKLTVLEGDKP